MPNIKVSDELRKIIMKKNYLIPTSNVSEGVEFFLRGARKRRSMAIASVRQVNTDVGVSLRLVAVK